MKVAIVADSISSRHLAPYDDLSWETWGLGNGGQWHVKRATRYFEPHTADEMKRTGSIGHLRTVGKDHQTQILYVHPSLLAEGPFDTDVQPFPLELVSAITGRRYFTSTVAYMAAFAITFLPEITDLALYGVDMSDDTEYGSQRRCLEYWIGVAEAKGIRITIPPQSPLLSQTWLYGYEDEENVEMQSIYKRRYDVIKRDYDAWIIRMDECTRAVEQARARILEADDLGKLRADFPGWDARVALMKQNEATSTIELVKAQSAVSQMRARLGESIYYLANHTYGSGEGRVVPEPLAPDRKVMTPHKEWRVTDVIDPRPYPNGPADCVEDQPLSAAQYAAVHQHEFRGGTQT